MVDRMENAVEQNRTSGSGFLYLLVGIGLGSLITLLFAPQSGTETRDTIAQKAQEVQDRATSWVEQGKEAIKEKAQQVSAAVDAGREAYQQELARGKAASN